MARISLLNSSRTRLLSVLAMLGLVGSMAWLSPAHSVRAAGTTLTVTIHYFRYDGNYLTGASPTWDVWSWNDNGAAAGAAQEFNGSDSFGKLTTYTQTCTGCTQIGFIVRVSDWSNREASTNGNGNRYIPVVAGQTSYSAWVVTGDLNTYFSQAAADAAKQLSLETAYLDSPSAVTVTTNQGFTLSNGNSGFHLRDMTAKANVPIKGMGDGFSQPGLTLAVAGDFQSKLGDTNWNPNSTITRMHSTLNGTLYQFTANLPAGSYQYKVTTPGWASSWPAANVSLVLNGAEQVTFSYAPDGNQVTDSINNSGQPLPGDPGWKANILAINLKAPLNVRHVYQVSASATSQTPALQPITVVPQNVLDGSAYYYGGQLGAIYSSKSTTFRLWAPDATKVVLQLFKTETGGVSKSVTMRPAKKGGIVQATVKGNLANEYYLYQVSAVGQTHSAVDPYAVNVAPNGTRAMVVNLSKTNPAGWTSDQHVGAANPVDASIYEVHVRDFTIDANSGVSAANRGTYLGFTQTGTTGPGGVSTGIDSLKQLGVKDVELMPTYRFATLDETKSYSAFCPDVSAGAGNPCYNWGYDPANYNTPEGAYATSAHGTARITQFKQMVHAIHGAGMGVILDAVYNHVFDTSVFNNIVPQYYFRTSRFGVYYNGSGQGNEVATEKPMVFKFAEDSMKYWMQQYHVDGFRMDEMFLFGKAQLAKLLTDLRKIEPGVVVLGEPWGNPGSGLPASQQVTPGNQQGLGLGIFNADIRNSICCDSFNNFSTGFANGGGANTQGIENGVVGSINYSNNIGDWAAAPSESINYVSNHDNWTLWDHINNYSNAGDTLATKELIDELAQAIVVTSQGVPFIQGGEEFLRTKSGPNSGNSYDGGDAENQFNWSLKNQNISVFNYYAGLFHLRNAHPAFRMTTAAQIKSNLSFLNSPGGTVAYELNGTGAGDSWSHIIVMYNGTSSSQNLNLPSGSWTIVGNQGHVGTTSLGSASSTVSVPGLTTEILHQ